MAKDFEEPQDVLGQTGKTVVYVFPKGAACKLRDQNEVACRLDALVSEQPTLLEAPAIDVDAIIKQLLQQGHLTEAQIQVGRYDQETTGMHIFEALAARGWLTPNQIEDFWNQLT
jgi:hypothetical protein